MSFGVIAGGAIQPNVVVVLDAALHQGAARSRLKVRRLGYQREIHAERDQKLEEGRKQRQISPAAGRVKDEEPTSRVASEVDNFWS